MKVIGSQSTRSYLPGKERNLHAIGRDLGVRHLLEGTVSRDHDQMRVALHLVDLRDGADSLDRNISTSAERRVRAPNRNHASCRRAIKSPSLA